MRCSDQLASDPVSAHTAGVDCDVAESGEDVRALDPVLRRVSSLPEDTSSASQNSPVSLPLSPPHQPKTTAGSRLGGGGIVAERAKRFSEKGHSLEKTSDAGRASPSSSSQSSRCSRDNSSDSLLHSGEYRYCMTAFML